MDWSNYVRGRLPQMSLSPEREAEIVEELGELLEDTYDDARRSGLAHEAAFAKAAGALPEGRALAIRIEQAERPAVSRIPEAVRGRQVMDRMIGWPAGRFMHGCFQDVRYALRVMARHPNYTALAVIALALGIGANTAIFSLSYALLEKAVAVPDLKGLCVAEEYRLDDPLFDGLSPKTFADWREQSRSFMGLAATQWYDTNISGSGTPERVQGFRVTANFFDVLRAAPLHGRAFLPGEDLHGRGQVAVLGYGLWKRRFAGDPAIVGRTVRLEGRTFEIVGVMPKEFDYPVSAELWMPLALTAEEWASRTSRTLTAVARLKPEIGVAEANAELSGIGERLMKDYPVDYAGWGSRVMTIRQDISGNMTREYMTLMMGAVAFVLLIAVANVANLQLARATSRYREVALRIALGASRWRVVRPLLAESVLQSLAAMALGMLFARWTLDLIRSNFPPDILKYVPGINVMSLDWPTFLYSFGLAVIAGVLAGIMPALHVSRPDLNEALREGGRGAGAGRGRHRTRNLLVIAEVSLALVLLVGAGLMIRGVGTMLTMHDAIRPGSILVFNVNLPDSPYQDLTPRVQFFDRVLEKLSGMPGQEGVGLGRSVPFADGSSSGAISLEGRPAQPGESRHTQYQYVNEGWFRLFGIPLREGRLPNELDGDGTQRVVVVSEKLARRYWPGESPVGRRIKLGNDISQNPWMTIAGVVGDVHYRWWDREPGPVIYMPYRQAARQYMQFAMRVPGNPLSLAEPVRKAVAAVDPDMPVFDVKTHARMIRE